MSDDESNIGPDTLRAYRETDYRVLEPAITLKVCVPSPELAHLHEARGVTCSAFVTAFNPLGERLGDAENHARQERLRETLGARGLPALDAIGAHPRGDWEEPSFLVLGLEREAACALGRELAQNAIVWAGADAVPRLVPLR